MKALIAPRVVLSLAAGFGLVAALLAYADVGRVVQAVGRFQPPYLLLLLALTVGYQVLRAVQWFLLLRSRDRRQPWRVAVMSYMGGELVKGLPGGQYAQTYLLRRAQGTPIAASAAATTLILWLEVVVCLAIVAILGVGPWTWVRPAALALLAGIGLIALLLKHRARPARRAVLAATYRAGRLRSAITWLDTFIAAMGGLLRARTLGTATAISAGYVACAAGWLWALAAALGVHGLGVPQALAAYAFALAVGLIVPIPIPIDIGLTELGGLAALMACGAPRAEAVAVLLLHRGLSAVLSGAVALTSLALLRQQVRAALRAGEGRSRPAWPRAGMLPEENVRAVSDDCVAA